MKNKEVTTRFDSPLWEIHRVDTNAEQDAPAVSRSSGGYDANASRSNDE